MASGFKRHRPGMPSEARREGRGDAKGYGILENCGDYPAADGEAIGAAGRRAEVRCELGDRARECGESCLAWLEGVRPLTRGNGEAAADRRRRVGVHRAIARGDSAWRLRGRLDSHDGGPLPSDDREAASP